MTKSRGNNDLSLQHMPQSNQVIISEMITYMAQGGGRYSDWYVGIAFDPRQRLFNDHNVQENAYGWIFREAFNSESARSVESHFTDTLRTDGDTGGGDNTTKFVYAYKKASSTRG